MVFAASADPAKFDEACSWFLKRVVLTADQAEALGNEAGRRAFWVGLDLQLDQVQSVFDKISKAIESGEPFEEWRKRVRNELTNDAHALTVFRNAVQRSYNAGRYEQMRAVQKWRPHWQYDSVLDSRTTEVCKVCNGTILPADHEWWLTHIPPSHHRCRASIRSLTVRDSARRGGPVNVPPAIGAAEGFGLAPDKQPVWKPDLTKVDPELAKEAKKKETKPRKPPPKPASAPKEHDPKYWEERYRNGESALAADYGEAAPAVAWGRAMLERALDRSAGDVLAEIQKQQKARNPSFLGLSTAPLEKLEQTRPLRDQVVMQDPRWRAILAMQEHARTIKSAKFELPKGSPRAEALTKATRWYSLMLEESVRRPTGTVLDTVRIDANVRDYFSPTRREIVLSDREDIPVATHELAHAIEESSDRTLQRSKAFLEARTKGEVRRLLNDILKTSAFKGWEESTPDKFYDPYVGKFYRAATEITSMGYERMVNSWNVQYLMKEDPEMLLFCLGQLAGR